MSRPDPLPPLLSLVAALGAEGSSDRGFAALEAAAGAMFGYRLFSIMQHDAEGGWNARVYSNQPEAYPVGGRKPVRDTAWARQLFTLGDPWLCRDAEEIRATFPDHALIASLGCAAGLNLPVRWQGRTLGTLNLFHQTGWYDAEDLPAGRLLAGLAVPVLVGRRQG